MSSFCCSRSRMFSSSFENSSQQINEEDDFHEDYAQDEEGDQQAQVRDFSQNTTSLTFSWSLMNQLRSMSRVEGVSLETLLIELVSEGVAKRVFEDQNRPAPSHLLTRNGYVHTDEREGPAQPQMSHHMNRSSQNRNKFHFQSKNNNGQFTQNNKNQMRGNYISNHNGRTQNNGQGTLRNNNGQYQQQQQQPSKFNRPKNGNSTQARSVSEEDYPNSNYEARQNSKK